MFWGEISTSGRYSHSNTMEINMEYQGGIHESIDEADHDYMTGQYTRGSMFKPAKLGDVEKRKEEWEIKKEEDAAKRAEEYRTRYTRLTFTYEDITNCPGYKRIMDLGYVTDISGPIQKQHRTVQFRLRYGEQVTRSVRIDRYDISNNAYRLIVSNSGYKDYAVFANGYVRYFTTHGHFSRDAVGAMLKKFDRAETVADYSKFLDFLYPIMVRKYNKETQASESVNNEWQAESDMDEKTNEKINQEGTKPATPFMV
jgi:hypothetical protein